jgi:hypothetical protein
MLAIIFNTQPPTVELQTIRILITKQGFLMEEIQDEMATHIITTHQITTGLRQQAAISRSIHMLTNELEPSLVAVRGDTVTPHITMEIPHPIHINRYVVLQL